MRSPEKRLRSTRDERATCRWRADDDVALMKYVAAARARKWGNEWILLTISSKSYLG